MPDKYKFVCLNCNEELGRAETEHNSPPTTCEKCGGTRVATQPIIIKSEDVSMNFDVVIFNKSTGVSKCAGFTLSPEEYRKIEGEKLKNIFATKMAESLSQMLTQRILGELVQVSEVKQ